LLRVLSDSTVRAPPRRTVRVATASGPHGTPWNLMDPDLGHADLRPEYRSSSKLKQGHGNQLVHLPHASIRAPALTTPAPPLPPTDTRQVNQGLDTALTGRTGRPLSTGDRRKATIQNRYMTKGPQLSSVKRPDRPLSFEEQLARAFLASDVDGSRTLSKREYVPARAHPSLVNTPTALSCANRACRRDTWIQALWRLGACWVGSCVLFRRAEAVPIG
jgi:hypothetical protein